MHAVIFCVAHALFLSGHIVISEYSTPERQLLVHQQFSIDHRWNESWQFATETMNGSYICTTD
jgi:hypothetical protein